MLWRMPFCFDDAWTSVKGESWYLNCTKVQKNRKKFKKSIDFRVKMR